MNREASLKAYRFSSPAISSEMLYDNCLSIFKPLELSEGFGLLKTEGAVVDRTHRSMGFLTAVVTKL